MSYIRIRLVIHINFEVKNQIVCHKMSMMDSQGALLIAGIMGKKTGVAISKHDTEIYMFYDVRFNSLTKWAMSGLTCLIKRVMFGLTCLTYLLNKLSHQHV